MKNNNFAVFCGGRIGKDKIVIQETKNLAYFLSTNNKKVIFGGGSKGIMGIIRKEMLKNKGQIIGVIPQILIEKEKFVPNLSKHYITKTMHQRKQKMYQLADACIILPGGIGTLDELAEVITWNQLEIHKKPVYLINVNGYYDNLLRFLDTCYQNKMLYKNPEFILKEFKTVADFSAYIINLKG